MKVLGYELLPSKKRKTKAKSTSRKTLKKKYSELKQENKTLKKYDSLFNPRQVKVRESGSDYPTLDLFRSGYFYEGGIVYPLQFWEWRDLQNYSDQSDLLRLCKSVLKKEVFRRGFDWQPAFEAKCLNCEKVFENAVEECDECHGDVREPNQALRQFVEERLGKKNAQGKTLVQVLKQVEDDLNTLDNGWLIAIKDYLTNEDGAIVGSETKEFIRGDPNTMRIVADMRGVLGQKWWMCPAHRTDIKEEPGECTLDGNELRPVHYASVAYGTHDAEFYYLEEEVLHLQKYSSTQFYGIPPVFTVILKALAEVGMDKFVYDAYSKQRMPKGLITINTDNPDSLDKEWKRMLARVKDNPHYVPMMGVSSNKGEGSTQFLNFMSTLNEMQYVDSRIQVRRMVGAFYGVEPLFLGDVSSSGGLNNEGLQITVTNRALESAHQIYNEDVFPWIMKQFNVEDWVIEMNPTEERDEMAELQREHQKAVTAQTMQAMGFEVTKDEAGEFVFSDKPVNPPLARQRFGETGFGEAESFGGLPFGKKKELTKFAGERKASELKNLLVAELDELQERTNFKSFNQQQIRKTIAGLMQKISKSMFALTAAQLKDAYVSGLNKVGHDVGITIKFGGRDEDALKIIQNQRVLSSAYSDFTKTMTKKTNAAIKEAFKEGNITTKNIVDKLGDTIEANEGRLSRIARTETHKVINLGREAGWAKAQEGRDPFLFKWGGPRDNRTTIYCQTIKKQVREEGGGSGVSMTRLKEIIKENADQNIYQDINPWTVHINCRHELQRIV